MVVSLLLTIVLTVLFFRRGWCAREGFESGPDAATNVMEQGKAGLAALTDKLHTTIGFLNSFKKRFDDDFKNDRISLAGKSPIELARLHLQSQQPK